MTWLLDLNKQFIRTTSAALPMLFISFLFITYCKPWSFTAESHYYDWFIEIIVEEVLELY